MAANTIAIVIGKIVRRFASANAFNEDNAKTLKELGLENRHQIILNGLIRRGSVIRTSDEKYYLSDEYYQRRKRYKKAILPIVCLALFLLILFSCVFFIR